MAKNNNEKRIVRMEKSKRNMDRAVELLTGGFLAEFYLLLVNNYFVKGGAGGSAAQLVAMAGAMKWLTYLGLVLVAAGIVLVALDHKKGKGISKLDKWLVIAGVFFTLSSQLMRRVYPQGTTALCIFVPVLMILGVLFFLYPREFFAEASGLSLSIFAMELLNRGAGKANWTMLVKAYCFIAVVAILALLCLAAKAQKNGGCIKDVRLFSANADYTLLYIVLAVCAVAICAAVFVGSLAFYGTWVLSAALFILAVYYTVKML